MANNLDFQYISLLEIAENLVLADKRSATDFSAKSSFHCILFASFLRTTGSGMIENCAWEAIDKRPELI